MRLPQPPRPPQPRWPPHGCQTPVVAAGAIRMDLIPVQAARAGDRVLVCIRPAGRWRSTRLGSASRTLAEFSKRSKNQTSIFFTQRQRASLVPPRDGQNPCTLLRFENAKKQKNIKRMHFTNRIRALAANMLQNVARQETTRIYAPSPSFQNAQKIKHQKLFYTAAACIIGSARRRPKSTYPPQL